MTSVSIPQISRPIAKSLHPGVWGRVRPGLLVRLRASWKAAELGEALAAGADPLASEELLWRAQQLTEPKERMAIAESIARVVAEIDRGGFDVRSGPQIVKRDLIKDNRSLLLVLAERLRDDGPHDLRGLAMAELLVHFGDSPLYRARSPLELRWKLLDILTVLYPGEQAGGQPV